MSEKKGSSYSLLLSNTVVFAIGTLLVKLISFFLMPLYTSVLTTEQYGVAELFNSAIEIILPIATLSIVEALYRFSIDSDKDHESLFVNSLVIIITGDIIVIIASILLSCFTEYHYILEFCVLYCSISFYRLTIQFARGMGHTKRYAGYGVLNSLLLVASNYILLVVYNGGVSAYLLSFSIGYGVAGLVAFVSSKEYRFLNIKKFRTPLLKSMLRYCIPSIPNMLSWWVNSVSDRYIVLLFWGSGVSGLYTAASKLPAMINMLTSVFQQAWQYSTAIEIGAKNSKSFFSNVFRIYDYFCVFICAVLILLNKVICKVLLQADFYVAWKFVPILLLAATYGCIATYFGTFYNAIKNNTMLMVSTSVGAVTNIILNFTLIPSMGGIGAAIATAVSYFIVMIIRIINVRNYVEVDIDIKKIVFQFVVLFIAVVFGCFQGTISIFVTGVATIVILLSDIRMLKYGVSIARGFIKRRK